MAANPLAGLSKNEKTAVVVGGAAVAGYIWYKHSQSKAAAAASPAVSTGDLYPADGSTGNSSDPNSTDPATGQTYGNEGYTSSYGYAAGGTTSSGATTTSGTTNQDWIESAETGLVNDLGYSSSDVQAAFAVWVSGGYLTADQAAIIHAALTEFPGGPAYPIKLAPTTGGGTGTGSSGGTTATAPASAPGGLSATGHAGFADFGWGAVAGATGYDLSVSGAGGKGTGTSSASPSETGNHAANVQLAKGKYKWQVRAKNSAGAGPWASGPQFTVT